MNKNITKIILVALYCFPYAYFSMYIDFTKGSMLGYLFMVLGMSLLAFMSKRFAIVPFAALGNILSAVISYISYRLWSGSLGEGWDYGYFKPLAPNSFIILIIVISLMPQLLVVLYKSKEKKE